MGLSRRALCWWPAGSRCPRRAPVAPGRRAAARARPRSARQPSGGDLGRRRAVGRARRRGAERQRLQPLTLDFDALSTTSWRRRPRGRARTPSCSGSKARRTAGDRDGRGGTRAATSPSGRWRRSSAAVPRRDDRLDVQRRGRARRRAVPLGTRRAARSSRRRPRARSSPTRRRRTPSDRSTPRPCTSSLPRSRPVFANARRFADVEARLLLDPATGVANRRGYEVELGREVARATERDARSRSCSSASANGSETTTTGSPTSVDQFARLLTRVTRQERHLVQARRARVRDPAARNARVGRHRPHRAPSRRGDARARVAPADDRGGARRVAARASRSRRSRRAPRRR